MSEEKVFDKIVQFLNVQIGESWWSKKPLSVETKLSEDLRIDGADAIDFFTAFEKHFNIDMTSLDLRKFFNNEGFDPIGLSWIIMKLGGKTNPPKESYRPITLGHLEEVIKQGKWIDHN